MNDNNGAGSGPILNNNAEVADMAAFATDGAVASLSAKDDIKLPAGRMTAVKGKNESTLS